MGWPLATLWAEFELIRLREGGRMASESMLQQSMLTASLTGKDNGYKKKLEDMQHGR